MRPFGWTSLGARWLFDALRPGARTTSICLRNPTRIDQAYFLRGYLQTLFARWGFGGGEFSNTWRSSIANVGKVRGGSGGPKGSGSSNGGGSSFVLHGASAGTSTGASAAEAKALNESIVAHIARRYGYRDTPAATLSRQSVQRVLALRQFVPLLGFAGVCLVDKPTVITPDEELEGVCVEIRKIFDKINFDIFNREVLPIPGDKPVNLSNFELGDPIAKGCNAVVYSAKLREQQESNERSSAVSDSRRIPTIEEEPLDADESGSPPLSSSPPRKYAAELEAPAGTVDIPNEDMPSGPLGAHDLALKMMFNYDAESNAAAIWQSLSRECAPLQAAGSGQEGELNLPTGPLMANREADLPPHPCIVDVKAAFVDRVPLLRGAAQLYPVALPPRLHEHGIGRNATMFLVMKRYHCSLRSYIRNGAIERSNRPEHVRLSLCAQLFEAVAHLVSHGVAHRDMKSDNILVELPGSNGECCPEPRIALTDFGCCLIPADCITPLRLAFISGQVSRGGNVALMPPEVQSAKPGLLSFIDYSKADLWSAATLIFEIYGQRNPFYEGTLHSRTYIEHDLPTLDGAPIELRALVTACLQRDPSKRPTPAVAATVLQVLLYAPSRLFKSASNREPAVNVRDIVEWLCDISVDSLFAARREEDKEKPCSADQMLKRMLLGRVQLQTVIDALKFILEAREAAEDDDEHVEHARDDVNVQGAGVLAEAEEKERAA